MTHLRCNTCGSTDHVSGFGIGFGFYGAYCLCSCGLLIWRHTDVDDLGEAAVAEMRRFDAEYNLKHSTPTEHQVESQIQNHIAKLGLRVKDRVTGVEGVVVSVSFDLYGCVQAIVNRGVDKDGKPFEHAWFDIARLAVLDPTPVMDVPNFDRGPVAEGLKGSAEKPPTARY